MSIGAVDPCTCSVDGNARRCTHHTQADFDAAEKARNDPELERDYSGDLIRVKTQTLIEVGTALERLRLDRPMNGDGSNYMLDKVLAEVMKLDGTGAVSVAVEDERRAILAKRNADYLRLEEENRVRRFNHNA